MAVQLHDINNSITAPPRLMQVLWQYRRTIIVCAALGGVLGIIIALLRPLTYTSSATVLFPANPASRLSALTGDGGGDLPSMPLLDGALSVPQPGTSAATANLLLHSRRVSEKMVAQLQLKQRWQLTSEDEGIKRFQQKLQCKPGKSGELVIGFQDKSGKVAYEVVDKLVDELQSLSRELGLNPAEANIEFLDKQLVDAQMQMDRSQQALLAFQRKSQMLSVPDEAKLLIQQYSQTKQDAIRANLEASAMNRQVQVLSTGAQQLIQACQDPMPSAANTLAPLYKNVIQLETELALLKEKLTPEHPDVQDKTAELNEAKAVLNREIARQMALLKSGSSPAVREAVVQASLNQAKADGLQSAVSTLKQQVDKLPQQQAEYIRLTTELDASTEAVKLFRGELEKARILAKRDGPAFVIVDPAVLPRERDPAHRGVIVLLTLMIGSSFGLLFPYFEWFRRQQQYEDARYSDGLGDTAQH